MSNRKSLGLAAGLAALAVTVVALSPRAVAFGIEPPEKGVGSEHERITRAAVEDMEPKTLSALAGNKGKPGAVGSFESMDLPALHCDDGDHLEGTYPRSAADAEAALTACKNIIRGELEGAVGYAKGLLAPTAESTALKCHFDGKMSAKCEVLLHLGRAFHTAQDFYARTNWVDTPARGKISPANPPGLGKQGRSPWLDLRAETPFPQGLISGCVTQGEVLNSCAYGWVPYIVEPRVTREALNKDLGPIGKGGAAGAGFTRRGAVNDNFRNAVAAAIEDTRDKWAYFKERVRAVYGSDADTIFCALTRDSYDAATCAKVVATSSVCTSRAKLARGEANASSAVPSDAERQEAEPLADSLQRFCQLEEADLTRDAVLGGGKAADGKAYARSRAIEILSLWNACPVEARTYLDRVAPEHKDALKMRPAGEAPTSAPKRRELLGASYADCVLGARLGELGK